MIAGKKVCLRPYKLEDVATLMALRNDRDIQAALMARATQNDEAKTIDWLNRRRNEEDSIFLVVADRESDVALGFIQLIQIDPINLTGQLGICIMPAAQRKGYALEALHLLERYAAQERAISKIVLHVLSDNVQAITLYEKVGFDTVGIYKKHHFNGDKFLDVTTMEKILGSR